jgi:hypothetical protein
MIRFRSQRLPNANSIQARGLLAWWPVLPTRGAAVWYDRCSIGLNASMVNLVESEPVPVMGCTKRWTPDSYYSIADCGVLNDLGSQVGFVIWARLTEVIGGQAALLCKLRTNPANFSYYIFRSTAELTVNLTTDRDPPSITVPNVFDDIDWHCIVASYNGAELVVYVDGVEAGRTAGTGNIKPGTLTELRIGARGNDIAYWQGDIADVRIYNRALTPADAWQIYAPQTRWELYTSKSQVFTYCEVV